MVGFVEEDIEPSHALLVFTVTQLVIVVVLLVEPPLHVPCCHAVLLPQLVQEQC